MHIKLSIYDNRINSFLNSDLSIEDRYFANDLEKFIKIVEPSKYPYIYLSLEDYKIIKKYVNY